MAATLQGELAMVEALLEAEVRLLLFFAPYLGTLRGLRFKDSGLGLGCQP